MASAFEDFVNDNLPPKISIDAIPAGGNADAGKIPVFTGTGLEVSQENLDTAVDTVRVGTSAVAQYATIQEAMAYARTDPLITEIAIEPGTYNETGYLHLDISITLSATNPSDRPSINFADTTMGIYFDGDVDLWMKNVLIVKFGASSDYSAFVIGGAYSSSITPILQLDNAGFGIVAFIPGTYSLRSITQEDTNGRRFQLRMNNESYLTCLSLNGTEASGFAKGVELKYPSSHLSSTGANVLELNSGSYIQVYSKGSSIGVEWDWLNAIYMNAGEIWTHPGSNTMPAEYVFIKTNCIDINAVVTNSSFLNYGTGYAITTQPQKITIFDCPTNDATAYIKSRYNIFFDQAPGTVENNIFRNLQNSITVQSVMDLATANTTISRDGDASEVATYSILEGSGLLQGSTGYGYSPDNSAHWSGDPVTTKEAIDRMAAAIYVLQGNTPIT